uniref:Uncharacterized protein n=1 Tax=Anguilla anguilla TaxID=7936 RepID=A0A0E9RN23_ANGAN
MFSDFLTLVIDLMSVNMLSLK